MSVIIGQKVRILFGQVKHQNYSKQAWLQIMFFLQMRISTLVFVLKNRRICKLNERSMSKNMFLDINYVKLTKI